MKKYGSFQVEETHKSVLEFAEVEISTLKDEIEDWKGSLDGTNFEQSDRYEQLEDVESILENSSTNLADLQTMMEDGDFLAIKVSRPEIRKQYMSRSLRLGNVIKGLEVVLPNLPLDSEEYGLLDVIIEDLSGVDFPTFRG